MKEHSFGIVPLQFKNKNWQVFLVKLKAGHWGFPKGHPEEGEEEREAAVRELFEETELVVEEFLPFDPLDEHYTCVKHGIHVDKTVTYYLAKVRGSVSLQKEEIADGKWVLLEEAPDLITFEEAKGICRQVQNILEY